MALHAETITLIHVEHGEPDDSGVASETTTETEIAGCNVQPVGTQETIGEVEPVTGRWRVSTRAGEVHDEILVSDRVRYRGEVLEILGYPQHYRSVRPHTEFTIYRTGG